MSFAAVVNQELLSNAVASAFFTVVSVCVLGESHSLHTYAEETTGHITAPHK